MVADALRIDFAFEDFLALVHGATDQEYPEALGLGRKFLANQELDGVVVMPARRDYARIAPPRIRPDDLLTPDRDPYVLTEVLAQLGKAVGAQVVLVDLRAGASELSAPLLLDPRVHRVLVSTVSDQAVRGTNQLLRQLAHRAPRAHLIRRARYWSLSSNYGHQEILAGVVERLRPAALDVSRPTHAAESSEEPESTLVDLDAVTPVLLSPFHSSLLSLPASWHDVLDLATSARLDQHLRPLVETLRSAITSVDASPLPAAPTVLPEGRQPDADSLDQRRRRLEDIAKDLVFAEAAPSGGFLVTAPLQSLVEAHRTEVPIEVVIGGKGSGKTFTHLHLCEAQSWERFAERLGIRGVSLTAPIVPVLASQTLTDRWEAGLRQRLEEIAGQLTGGEPTGMAGVRGLINEWLPRDTDLLTWRRIWLTCFARAIGLDADPATAEETLISFARRHRAIFVLDGLEDLFQQFTSSPHQQQALRALLVECPDWLRTLRGRPLGLVVFVRRDLARAAVPQNFGQFEKRYEKYALRWDPEEALRLVAWVSPRRRSRPGRGTHQDRQRPELSEMLMPLWGDKMGSAKSGGSIRPLFLRPVDFNGQIQARDVVSFLAEAAAGARGDTRWLDRLLPPNAMRNALKACSRQKIASIQEENPPVGHLLDRLNNLPAAQQKVPFRREDVGLSQDEARLLETNGVLFRENDHYWIPEIYRHGLNFKAGGRPRVVNIANLVRRRND